MGGVAVYAGILAGCLAMWLLVSGASIRWSIMAMSTMLVLGVWDDIKNLPAIFRFIMQLCIVGAYMALTEYYIHNFYGLFGIHEISRAKRTHQSCNLPIQHSRPRYEFLS